MKTINRVLASLVLAATASVAGAQTFAKDFYAEGGLGPMKISGQGMSASPVVVRGTLGKNINPNLAVEGTYALTASKDNVMYFNTNVDVSVAGYGIYLKPKFTVAPGTEVFGRLGYTSAKLKATAAGVSMDSDRQNSWSYGVGMQTSLNKDWYAQADYMVFSKKNDITGKGLGVSVGYRF